MKKPAQMKRRTAKDAEQSFITLNSMVTACVRNANQKNKKMKKKPNPKLETALKKAIEAFEDLAKAYKDMGWDCAADDAMSETESYKRTLKRLTKKK